jgi:hypothetical protein
MRLLLLFMQVFTFISCGKEDKIIKKISDEVSFEEALTAQGCSHFFLTHPEVDMAISCEDGLLWVLTYDGQFTYGEGYDISELLNYVYVDPDENYVCDGAERVTNGSFEDGHELGNNKWDVFGTLPGWYADLAISDAPMEIQNGNIGGIMASEGSAKLELDSHGKNGFSQSNAYVSTDVATNLNKVYRVSFDYSSRVDNNASTNRVAVFWNGNKIASLNHSQRGWERYTLTVLGDEDMSQLSFQAVGQEDTLGGYIDNVSVVEVCE